VLRGKLKHLSYAANALGERLICEYKVSDSYYMQRYKTFDFYNLFRHNYRVL